MKPMDKILVRLRPSKQAGMTRLHLSGQLTTRLGARDVRRLWRAIEQLAEETCVALPVDAPLPWFDLWCDRLDHAHRLSIRFMHSRRSAGCDLATRRSVVKEDESW
jgi:hypothetical protein